MQHAPAASRLAVFDALFARIAVDLVPACQDRLKEATTAFWQVLAGLRASVRTQAGVHLLLAVGHGLLRYGAVLGALIAKQSAAARTMPRNWAEVGAVFIDAAAAFLLDTYRWCVAHNLACFGEGWEELMLPPLLKEFRRECGLMPTPANARAFGFLREMLQHGKLDGMNEQSSPGEFIDYYQNLYPMPLAKEQQAFRKLKIQWMRAERAGTSQCAGAQACAALFRSSVSAHASSAEPRVYTDGLVQAGLSDELCDIQVATSAVASCPLRYQPYPRAPFESRNALLKSFDRACRRAKADVEIPTSVLGLTEAADWLDEMLPEAMLASAGHACVFVACVSPAAGQIVGNPATSRAELVAEARTVAPFVFTEMAGAARRQAARGSTRQPLQNPHMHAAQNATKTVRLQDFRDNRVDGVDGVDRVDGVDGVGAVDSARAMTGPVTGPVVDPAADSASTPAGLAKSVPDRAGFADEA